MPTAGAPLLVGEWGGCCYVLRTDLVLARGASAKYGPRLVAFDVDVRSGGGHIATCRWATPAEAGVRTISSPVFEVRRAVCFGGRVEASTAFCYCLMSGAAGMPHQWEHEDTLPCAPAFRGCGERPSLRGTLMAGSQSRVDYSS